jgi:DNA-binding GntR family transcriptional regulator
MSKAAQRAYTAIRDSIISGDYAPGMHLTESELAGIVGVSRTPVHDALLRLKADGLIEMQRNQGARVKTYSNRDIDEIFELRAYSQKNNRGFWEHSLNFIARAIDRYAFSRFERTFMA